MLGLNKLKANPGNNVSNQIKPHSIWAVDFVGPVKLTCILYIAALDNLKSAVATGRRQSQNFKIYFERREIYIVGAVQRRCHS